MACLKGRGLPDPFYDFCTCVAYPRVEMAAGGTGFSSRSGRELGLRDCSIDCRFFDQLMDKAFKRYPEAAEDLMVTFILN